MENKTYLKNLREATKTGDINLVSEPAERKEKSKLGKICSYAVGIALISALVYSGYKMQRSWNENVSNIEWMVHVNRNNISAEFVE